MNIFKRLKNLEEVVNLAVTQINDLNKLLVEPVKKDEKRIFINRVPDWQKKYAEEQMRGEKGDK